MNNGSTISLSPTQEIIERNNGAHYVLEIRDRNTGAVYAHVEHETLNKGYDLLRAAWPSSRRSGKRDLSTRRVLNHPYCCP